MHQPDLFRRMAEPHESHDQCCDALNAFHADLRVLREKHKMANLFVVVGDSYRDDDGEPVDIVVTMTCGDMNRMEMLAAYGFGKMQADREATVARALSNSRRRKDPK